MCRYASVPASVPTMMELHAVAMHGAREGRKMLDNAAIETMMNCMMKWGSVAMGGHREEGG